MYYKMSSIDLSLSPRTQFEKKKKKTINYEIMSDIEKFNGRLDRAANGIV